MSLKREGNAMECERPYPLSFSILGFCASAQRLVDTESHALVGERTCLLANL